MKRLFSILLCVLALLPARAADLSLSDGDRIVFLGDSISEAKRWTHYTSSHLILMNPTILLHVQTEGRGGSTMSEVITYPGAPAPGNERYDRRVQSYNPDYVFIMFGHNGGISDTDWKADMQTVVDDYIIGKSGAVPILLGPHPKSTADGKPSLGAYEDRLEEIALAGGWSFAANWHFLDDTYKNSAFWTQLQWDGTQSSPEIHPGDAGHMTIFYSVIENLGWTKSINACSIAANTLTVTSTSHCAVRKLDNSAGVTANAFGGVDFKRLVDRMGGAVDERRVADGFDEAVAMIPAMDGFLQEMLVITGLADDTYELLIDGVSVGTFTDNQFTAGINLWSLLTGPEHDQRQEVLGRIRDMHHTDRLTLGDKAAPQQGVKAYQGAADVAYITNGIRDPAALLTAVNGDLFIVPVNMTSVSSVNDTLTKTSHGYSNGNRLRVSSTGALPTPLLANTDYYVVQKSSAAFKLSLTPGTSGTPENLTDTGSGTISVLPTKSVEHYDRLIHEAAQPVERVFSVRSTTGGGGGPPPSGGGASRLNPLRKGSIEP